MRIVDTMVITEVHVPLITSLERIGEQVKLSVLHREGCWDNQKPCRAAINECILLSGPRARKAEDQTHDIIEQFAGSQGPHCT